MKHALEIQFRKYGNTAIREQQRGSVSCLLTRVSSRGTQLLKDSAASGQAGWLGFLMPLWPAGLPLNGRWVEPVVSHRLEQLGIVLPGTLTELPFPTQQEAGAGLRGKESVLETEALIGIVGQRAGWVSYHRGLPSAPLG